MTHSTALIIAALAGSIGAANSLGAQQYSCSSHPGPTENLGAQLAKFRPVQMRFNTTGLSAREVQMVRKLVEAGQYLESAFWRESDPQGLAIYQALANCPGATEKEIHHYLLINGSRYDLLEGNKPFLANTRYEPGHALYPAGITRKEIEDYVAAHPDKLIGFLSVDPTQPGWQDEMRFGHEELKLEGIKLLPMYAGFRPDDKLLDPLWQYATRRRLPVLLHTGTTFVAQAPLECTLPRHLDPVAARFPEVKIIMAHLGHPYEGEAIVTARKHPNVYVDISALHYRPFQFYQSLMLVQEYGVWHKLLFGTDYPFTNVNATIDGLRGLNRMLDGTALPRLSETEIEAMIHRDSLGLLGLEGRPEIGSRRPETA